VSGISGLYYLDNRPVKVTQIEKMNNSLAHRGADDSGLWYEGAVALGHRMLWVTPEAYGEQLPARQGNLVLTADARLDNRDELIPLLGF
jgi:asparagine synthase (glutamine-hydrolysing)